MNTGHREELRGELQEEPPLMQQAGRAEALSTSGIGCRIGSGAVDKAAAEAQGLRGQARETKGAPRPDTHKCSTHDWMQGELAQLREEAQLRSLHSTLIQNDGWLVQDGRRLLNLSSNHYLGLDHHLDAEVLEELQGQAAAWGGSMGTGSTASRLITGGNPVLAAFEAELAAFKGTEGSLLFGSGYQANVGIIQALAGRGDTVFSDRLNHASITDGIVLSRADHRRYRHRDLDQLEAMLRKTRLEQKNRRLLIVTDAVFSMDGTIAPLAELVWLKQRYGAMLMVDEAHSGGIYGTEGQGLIHALGLTDAVDVQMGTFGKAYGCYGAYAAGDRLLIEYLVNKARSLIYTTALPPLMVLCISRQWRMARREGWRRQALLDKSAGFRSRLQEAGLDTCGSSSHIVPVLAGDNSAAVELSARLREAGLAATAIRPPTVPEGTARIRFTLMATQPQQELDRAADTIIRVCKELGQC